MAAEAASATMPHAEKEPAATATTTVCAKKKPAATAPSTTCAKKGRGGRDRSDQSGLNREEKEAREESITCPSEEL